MRLDPDLRTVRDKQGFLKAYQGLGGTIPQNFENGGQGSGARPQFGANPIISALTNGNSWVDPELKGDVDAERVDSAASATKKIVVTSTVSPYRDPTTMASEIRKALNLGEGIVIVVTPRRIGASSGRISTSQINDSLQNANLNQATTRGGLTEAAVTAAQAVEGTVTKDRNTDNGIGTVGVLAVVGSIAGFLGFKNYKAKKAFADAKEPLERLRRQALDSLSYADGYLDLLPKGDATDRARQLRAEAYQKYETAGGLISRAHRPEDLREVRPLLESSLSQLTECRQQIDLATGGTGVAATVPELFTSLDTPEQKAKDYLKRVDDVRSQSEAQELQRQIEQIPTDQRGVSFFSGRPIPASDLVPVTIVVDGRKQTVMASRDEAEEIKRDRMPQVSRL